MGKITNEMVHTAYQIGVQVHNQQIGRQEGRYKIAELTGMDSGSANDYITVLLAMLAGEEYHRTINFYATQYYFDNIEKDFGRDARIKAARATKAHTKYYAALGHGHQVKIEKLAEIYISK